MKIKYLLMAVVSCLVMSSCGDDDDDGPNYATTISGTYTCYSEGYNPYTKLYTNGETLIIKADDDDSNEADIKFISSLWGTAIIDDADVKQDGDSILIEGTGSFSTNSRGTQQTYPCSISGSVAKNNKAAYIFTIVIPKMTEKGTIIVLRPGVHEEENNNDKDRGTFNLYSTVEGTSFGTSAYFTDLESDSTDYLTISSTQKEGTVNVSYKSSTWGKIEVNDASIVFENDNITIEGSGICTMGRPGTTETSDYDCTLKGEINTKTNEYVFTFLMPDLHKTGMTVVFKN